MKLNLVFYKLILEQRFFIPLGDGDDIPILETQSQSLLNINLYVIFIG